MEQKAWQGTTYGNAGMHRWLIKLLRRVNIRLIYGFTNVFVIPVCLALRSDRRHIYRYLRRRQGYGRMRAAWATYRNECLFGQVVIDRFAMYAGKRFRIEIEGYEHFQRLSERNEGFVQLSAHIGNYELAGYSLKAKEKRFNAIVFANEKETVMRNREKMFEGSNIHMITVKEDGSHVFEINNALASGDIVSMPADRLFGSSKSIRVSLLGAEMNLPLGPFATAVSRELDVIAVNVMKAGPLTYKIYVTPLPYDKTLRSREQMKQLAEGYAAELERMLKLYPEQWYNYFETWKE